MQIIRTCPVSKRQKTRELDVTPEEVYAWQGGKLIQDAMPRLNAEEREFVMSGIDGETWAKLFPPELQGDEPTETQDLTHG